MNSRPDAWLRQAHNDLALAHLAKDNGFLAQSCYYASQAAEKGLKGALLELGIEPATPTCSTNSCNAWGTTVSTPIN